MLVNGESPLSRSAMTPSGSGSPSIDERAAEPLDVRRLPRLARHQVLGDHARLVRPARLQVGVGQLRLRACTSSPRVRRPRRPRRASSAPGCGPGTRVTYSCRAEAAAGQSWSATAASVATSMHWNAALGLSCRTGGSRAGPAPRGGRRRAWSTRCSSSRPCGRGRSTELDLREARAAAPGRRCRRTSHVARAVEVAAADEAAHQLAAGLDVVRSLLPAPARAPRGPRRRGRGRRARRRCALNSRGEVAKRDARSRSPASIRRADERRPDVGVAPGRSGPLRPAPGGSRRASRARWKSAASLISRSTAPAVSPSSPAAFAADRPAVRSAGSSARDAQLDLGRPRGGRRA